MQRLAGFVAVVLTTLLAVMLVRNAEFAGSEQADNVVYVDRNSLGGRCSDAHTVAQAKDSSSPWCSLARAVSAAPAGSVASVRKAAFPPVSVSGGQARDGFLTVRPSGSDVVALAGLSIAGAEYVRFSGLRITGAVDIDDESHHVELIDNRIAPRTTVHGVTLHGGTHDVLVEDNHLTVPEGSGVHLSATASGPEISDVTIRGNHFDGIGIVGVQARRFVDVLVEGNEFEGVRSWDGVVHPDVIRTYLGGRGLVIRANNIHDNAAQGIFVKDGAVDGVVIENNLVARTTGGFKALNLYDIDGLRIVNNTFTGSAVFQGTARSVVLKNNIFGSLSNLGQLDLDYEDHNYIGAGSFPATGSHDLSTGLRYTTNLCLAEGSAGIDAGTSIVAPTRDRIGNRRVDDPDVTNRGTGSVTFQDIGSCERPTG